MFNDIFNKYTGTNKQNQAIQWLEKRLVEHNFYESVDKVDLLKMTPIESDKLESKISKDTLEEFENLFNNSCEVTIGDPIYYSQLDNSNKPYVTCNSSSNAMLLKTMKPNALGIGKNADDAYVKRILSGEFGYKNTNNPSIYHDAHSRALMSYGLETTWCTDRNEKKVKEQLARKIPTVVNILHKGGFNNLHGGHVIVLTKYENQKYFIFDPYGEIDGINGGYPKPGNNGKYWLSENTFDRRWQGGYRLVIN